MAILRGYGGHLRIARLKPYITTILVVIAVTLFKIAVNRFTGADIPFLLYYSAIILSAWIGGLRQGIFATALTLVTTHGLFVSPFYFWTMPATYPLRYALYSFDGVLVALVCSALQKSRQRAEKALRSTTEAREAVAQSELRFRRVFDSNMIGLMFTREDGAIVDCNDYVLDMLGYTRADLRAGLLNWRVITPAEYLEVSQTALRELRAGEAIIPFEKLYVCSDGTQVPVLIGPTRLSSDQIVTFVLDISERKQAEVAITDSHSRLEERVHKRTKELSESTKRLQQSQSFLDSVIENLPNMVFVKDAKELRFVRFNRAGEQLLGYERADLLGKNDFDFFPKEQAEFFQSKDRAVINARVVHDIPEEPLSTKSGLRYLHTKKIPIFGPDGEPQYLLGISEDITSRKAAEQQRLRLIQEQAARAEAEKTAEQLRFLSEASAALSETLDMKAMLDGFARIVVASFADWCEIVVVDPDELRIEEITTTHRDPDLHAIGTQYRRMHPIDWTSDEGIARVIRTGQPELHAVVTPEMIAARVQDPVQRELLLRLGIHSVILVPLRSFGRVVGCLSLISSSPARVFSQLDLSLTEDLSKRVSVAIENSRLLQKAQEASRAKSAFLANMSHEIRTPLGAMLGFAELMQDGMLDPEQKKYLSTLTRNGKQLLRIVDEILDFSKVESENIQVERVGFSLPSLIKDVGTLLRLQADEKGLQFKISGLKELPEKVYSDPTRLRQILINVFGNAIKFTPQGMVEITAEMLAPTNVTGNPMLQVRVADTGVGISGEQRDKLFQPFVQADNSMTRRFGGTGLGLFLSRRLAR